MPSIAVMVPSTEKTSGMCQIAQRVETVNIVMANDVSTSRLTETRVGSTCVPAVRMQLKATMLPYINTGYNIYVQWLFATCYIIKMNPCRERYKYAYHLILSR